MGQTTKRKEVTLVVLNCRKKLPKGTFNRYVPLKGGRKGVGVIHFVTERYWRGEGSSSDTVT